MDFELNQVAVYWERLAPDGYGGYTWEDPVEIDVRWEQSSEMFIDSSGERVNCNAKVFLGQDVKVGDYIYLGDADDLTSASGSPVSMEAAMPIKRFDKIPDLAGAEFLRRAWV
jgi:hypothetical protein